MRAFNWIRLVFAVAVGLPPALPVLTQRASAASTEPLAKRTAGEVGYTGTSGIRNMQVANQDGKDFDAAMNAVSERFHVAIIAEGAPIHATLDDDQSTALTAALRSSPPEARPNLTRIAAAFDYDLEETRYHVFLLRKRYSDPHDLPCVTYDELVHSLREIDKLTSVYIPVPPRMEYLTAQTDNPLAIFAASLRPDQLLAANKGIWANELDPDQQRLALNAAAWTMLHQKVTSVRKVLDHLVTLQNPNTTFQWMILQDKQAFGYQGPFGKGGHIQQYPLSNYFRSHVSGYESGYGPHPGSLADPTLPTAENNRLANDAIHSRSPFCVSLREAVMMDSVEASTKPGRHETRQRLTVEDGIADKPLSVFGLKYCTENQRSRSITDLYGLKVSETGDSRYSIKLPMADMSGTIADLPAEITRLVPLTLARAVESQITNYASKTPRIFPVIPGGSEEMQKAREANETTAMRDKVIRSAASEYYYSGVRRVLVLAEPSVPSQGSPAVPAMLLNPEVVRSDAIALVAGECAAELLGLANLEVPAFLHSASTLNVVIAYKEGISVTGGFGESNPNKRDGNGGSMFWTTLNAPTTAARKTSPVSSH